ncbi:cysteine--tRNA ligase [Ligilactobacillus salivarius]|uniref:Cysteine--tRNA ligase n=1 Tax=Ligilactobacillus salivarius (strain UCC118) TaxID=362948 RepID=SYC_LIGS1|nr:cysteine--tRNA ligase [Ligilactobacillus salivarius]Q1WSS5.1 RecName: Full=Cysteine--tRNA ligase; AltName: Full=Cysteinyl-tRNA synthetase; Short=CysRS [Ligilactobacillus salivarius UCC118]ABE00054.1 Cysteinyl-tRNA synthetase [Ligilactobacillus salivarius UCC118]MBZ4029633.1 cysteine--tRNA ligase [Ligilactobacillus salivarius]MDF4187941.1 cysteine--tRNA ligase [Ligilactobacillus salivarius]OQQ76059.1 cysteine--tRNA ligase [Ligilactobacillus salivarius]OQR19859.1 cysteine--tRNA ligase [Ligil
MLQLYNTLTNQKEKFEPLNPGKVTMYVCGPTVYNYIHIGNARSAVAFDTIRRYLEYRGFEVNYVSNFTDVDDKIIKASQEMNLSVKEITEKFINAFYEDTSALNVKKATLNPRVMDNMDDIIKFIEVLVQKGYAYESAGDVYYKTRKFKDYGKLSGQLIDDLEQGASSRVDDIDQDKKQDPLDFALWKKVKQGEISWNSPWGQGRPGWHIECSVMSTKYLGDTIDIHAGGQDLEFPHHENEIAQSEAKTGKKFARYWLHNGFVTIGEEDQKMSKSLGNFVTVHDLLKKVNPQVIRFFMSTTQYRRPIRYSSANLNEAKVNLNKLQTAYENLSYRLKDSVEGNDKEVEVNFANLEKDFVKVMDDDFNVQNGISVVYEMAKQLNVYSEKEKVYTDTINNLINTYKKVVEIFGISFSEEKELLDDTIEQLIQERNEARKNKNFKRSDEIRDLLKEQGIILEDTAQGTRWKRND